MTLPALPVCYGMFNIPELQVTERGTTVSSSACCRTVHVITMLEAKEDQDMKGESV
jgi:hypothetical protein